jgi:hypothetical protein
MIRKSNSKGKSWNTRYLFDLGIQGIGYYNKKTWEADMKMKSGKTPISGITKVNVLPDIPKNWNPKSIDSPVAIAVHTENSEKGRKYQIICSGSQKNAVLTMFNKKIIDPNKLIVEALETFFIPGTARYEQADKIRAMQPILKNAGNSILGESINNIIKIALEFIKSLRTHFTRGASAIAGISQSLNVRSCWEGKATINLTSSGNAPLVQRTSTTNNQAVVDQAHVVTEISVALVDFHLAVASFTGLLEVGVLAKASITCFTGNSVKACGQFFCSFKTSSSTLNIALNGFKIVLRREATSCISSSHNCCHDGLHWSFLKMKSV